MPEVPKPEDFPHVPRAQRDDQIDVFELKERLNRGEAPMVLDIREGYELEICELEVCKHLPLSRFNEEYQNLLGDKKEEELILLCRSGARTAQLQVFLKSQGYTQTRNLVGGILAWAEAIDPSLQKY